MNKLFFYRRVSKEHAKVAEFSLRFLWLIFAFFAVKIISENGSIPFF